MKEEACVCCGENSLLDENGFCQMCIEQDLEEAIHYSDEYREAYETTFLSGE